MIFASPGDGPLFSVHHHVLYPCNMGRSLISIRRFKSGRFERKRLASSDPTLTDPRPRCWRSRVKRLPTPIPCAPNPQCDFPGKDVLTQVTCQDLSQVDKRTKNERRFGDLFERRSLSWAYKSIECHNDRKLRKSVCHMPTTHVPRAVKDECPQLFLLYNHLSLRNQQKRAEVLLLRSTHNRSCSC